jgi:hypothetical protein
LKRLCLCLLNVRIVNLVLEVDPDDLSRAHDLLAAALDRLAKLLNLLRSLIAYRLDTWSSVRWHIVTILVHLWGKIIRDGRH